MNYPRKQTGNCGDITMSLALAAGTYTILLSDAGYILNAIFDSPSCGNLDEGFTDLTGGVFPDLCRPERLQ